MMHSKPVKLTSAHIMCRLGKGSTQEGMYSVKHNPRELSTRIPDYRRYSSMDAPVTGVLKTRKGEIDSNWCGYWTVNARCLETKVEIEGSGSDDSW